ncbi:MAG: non-canonical purine NTP pyrophosphatase, partial [Selenomonadaceae bacterium]|nr:non-canonical purine NTP pyrophosphatase [Selenomonadaceae bacterium]
GYDPYFYVAKDRTMAELSLEEKDRISHRGAALRRLVQLLEEYLK